MEAATFTLISPKTFRRTCAELNIIRPVNHIRQNFVISEGLNREKINPLNPELNPICYLLAVLGAHHFLHVSRIRVKLLTLRLPISYIYMEYPFLMFLDHTQRRSTVGRTPLDE
jgi:transposase